MIQLLLMVFTIVFFDVYSSDVSFMSRTIEASTMSELLVSAIKDMNKYGKLDPYWVQTYDVNYVLGPEKSYESGNYRIPVVRGSQGLRNFACRFLVYCNGSLFIKELKQISSAWNNLADQNGRINSNYGHYVFYQTLPEHPEKKQLDWVLECLSKDLYSRKACILIHQLQHLGSKDFPGVAGIQFCVQDNDLVAIVSCRSTYLFTGFAYDMGFFSFVHELVYRLLLKRLPKGPYLRLGYLVMKTNGVQIAIKTWDAALKFSETDWVTDVNIDPMPLIMDPEGTLKDIYNKTFTTPEMQWILKYAKMERPQVDNDPQLSASIVLDLDTSTNMNI